MPANRTTRYVRDKVKGQTPSWSYYTAFPCWKCKYLADRRAVKSYPLQRRYCLESSPVQSRFDNRRDHAMRSVQGHHVGCFGILSIFPNVRYPLADAHRRNSMTGEESRRHRSGLTGRGRRLVLTIVYGLRSAECPRAPCERRQSHIECEERSQHALFQCMSHDFAQSLSVILVVGRYGPIVNHAGKA